MTIRSGETRTRTRRPYRPAWVAAAAAGVAVGAAAAAVTGDAAEMFMLSVVAALAAVPTAIAARRHAHQTPGARRLAVVAGTTAAATLGFWLFVLFVAFQPR